MSFLLKMKPILFNTEMVRAIQNGSKTVTRRVIKFDTAYPNAVRPVENPIGLMTTSKIIRPPYQIGDILYVRETWQHAYDLDEHDQPIEETGRYFYAADYQNSEPFGFWVNSDGTHRDSMPWHPSIHMPKEAARIFLRVTDVRVERLQDIDGYGVLAEGVDNGSSNPTMGKRWENMQRMAYSKLWNSTVKKSDLDKYGWDANPWVTVNVFERISREETQQ